MATKLDEYIDRYDAWSADFSLKEENAERVRSPRYHYTTLAKLESILEGRTLWFTDYRTQDDTSELRHGLQLATRAAGLVEQGTKDERARWVARFVADLLQNNDLSDVIRCFVFCTTRNPRDVTQWDRFAERGEGCAIAFSRKFFAIEAGEPSAHNRSFVGQVRYPRRGVPTRMRAPIEAASQLLLAAATQNPDEMADKEVGLNFIGELARRVIARPLIWNCVTTKDWAYRAEQETRMALLGLPAHFEGHVESFTKGDGRRIEFVRYPFDPAADIEGVIVGPASSKHAEHEVSVLLQSCGIAAPKVRRSDVPYGPRRPAGQ